MSFCFQNRMEALLANQSFKMSSFCFVQFCSLEEGILYELSNACKVPIKSKNIHLESGMKEKHCLIFTV